MRLFIYTQGKEKLDKFVLLSVCAMPYIKHPSNLVQFSRKENKFRKKALKLSIKYILKFVNKGYAGVYKGNLGDREVKKKKFL